MAIKALFNILFEVNPKPLSNLGVGRHAFDPLHGHPPGQDAHGGPKERFLG